MLYFLVYFIVSEVVDGLTVQHVDLCMKDLKKKNNSCYLCKCFCGFQFMLRDACISSTFSLSFVSLPQRNKINYVTISSHRKEVKLWFFFCPFVTLRKSTKQNVWALFVVTKLLLFLPLNLFDEVCATSN